MPSGNGFWLVTNLLLIFRAFFCWWTPFMKLNCSLKLFSWIFADLTASGSSFFRLVETDFLLNDIHSDEWKRIFFPGVFLFRAHFVLVETIIQIKVNQFLVEQPFSYYWKPFSTRFLYIYYCWWNQFFGRVKTYFFNKSSIPAGGIRLFV